jgi:hypothetical protein
MIRSTTFLSTAALLAVLVAGCAGDDDDAADVPTVATETTPETEPPDAATETAPGDTQTTDAPDTQPEATAAPTTTTTTPAAASVALVGNATPVVPEGEPGVISLVYAAPSIDVRQEKMGFVLRNNTGRTLVVPEATAEARTADGTLIAVAEVVDLGPLVVGPGEIIVGSAYFGVGAGLPPDAVLTVDVSESDTPEDFRPVPLTVIETAHVPGDPLTQVDGIVRNDSDVTMEFGGNALIACFEPTGEMIVGWGAHVDFDTLAPGETASFSQTITDPCPTFLAYAWGRPS